MKCMMTRAVDTVKGVWSLVVGLAITGRYFVSPKRTTYYPRETVERPAADSFRGPIELVGTPKDPSIPKCISCMLCVQACPSNCITVQKRPAPVMTSEQQQAFDDAAARGENPKKPTAPKDPAVYHYNFTYCSLCACCVEACPVDSIRFSRELYLSGARREDFNLDLLARLKRTAANQAAARPAKEKPAPAPQAPASEPSAKEASA